MSRGSEFGGSRLIFFDCRPVLPKQGEQITDGHCTFALKTRVKTDENGQIVRNTSGKQIVRFEKNRPIVKPGSKLAEKIYPPVIANESDVWDYIEPTDSLSGYLVKVDVHEYEASGKTNRYFSLLLKDPKSGELYKISLMFNNVTYKFLNSFFNLDFGTEEAPVAHWLKIRISKYEGTDKNWYPTLHLYRASTPTEKNETVSWKYSKDETGAWVSEDGEVYPEVNKVQVGKQTVSDDSELQDFCLAKIQRISQILEGLKINDEGEIVSGGHESTHSATTPTNTPAPTESEEAEEPTNYEDDLPF